MDIIAVSINKGEWHRIKSRIYWSISNQGSMEFWLDDTQIEVSGSTPQSVD